MSIPSPAAFHHSAFLVHDLEGTARRLAETLAIRPWHVYTIEPQECRVRGEVRPFSFRVALATVGGGTFELVTPQRGPSILDEFLAERGDGFHHACLAYPTLAAVRAAQAALRLQGREPLQEARSGDAFEFAYFDLPELGSLVELLFLDPTRLPPADTVVE